MPSLSTKERKDKFNKLSNDLYIKLINGNRSVIFYMKKHIDNVKKS